MDSKATHRTLVAGVGHRFWGDLSVGPEAFDRWKTLTWPDSVEIDDYGFGALAMTQRLEDELFEQVIFVTAEIRDRAPGTLHICQYATGHESPDRVQAFVGEAGAGVVAIDPLLSIAGHFRALPANTWVLEVEPENHGWGQGLSPTVEALMPRLETLVRQLISDGSLIGEAELAGVRRDP